MYAIKAKVEFSGIAWGLHFIKGVARTSNVHLAKKLKNKGYEVEEIVDASIELEDMDVEQLKAYAKEKGIDIGNASSVKGIFKKIKDAQNETKDGPRMSVKEKQ
jgi:hypothetical protein